MTDPPPSPPPADPTEGGASRESSMSTSMGGGAAEEELFSLGGAKVPSCEDNLSLEETVQMERRRKEIG